MEQTNQPFEEAEILAVYSDFLNSSKSASARTDSKVEAGGGKDQEGENLAPQLLMLYYVLLYQDTLQSVSKSPGTWNRGVNHPIRAIFLSCRYYFLFLSFEICPGESQTDSERLCM